MVLETRELQFKNLVTPGDHHTDSATLSLLPPSEQAEQSSAKSARPKNQLTIFYAGSVHVYDDIPEDKANAIMLLAGNAVGGNMSQLVRTLACFEQPQPAAPPTSSPTALPPFLEPPLKVRKLQPAAAPAQSNLHLSLNSHFLRPNGSGFPNISCPALPSQALPQARKASLTRFLQRRKERILQDNAKQENNSTPTSDLKQDSPATQDGAKRDACVEVA